MGQCYTFNSGANGAELLTTPKGGVGNGLEVMLDVQEDEYLPVWKDMGTRVRVWRLEWGTNGVQIPLGRRGGAGVGPKAVLPCEKGVGGVGPSLFSRRRGCSRGAPGTQALGLGSSTEETPFEVGIRVQIHSQEEPPIIDQLGFGVAPGYQTFVSCQQQQVSSPALPNPPAPKGLNPLLQLTPLQTPTP